MEKAPPASEGRPVDDGEIVPRGGSVTGTRRWRGKLPAAAAGVPYSAAPESPAMVENAAVRGAGGRVWRVCGRRSGRKRACPERKGNHRGRHLVLGKNTFPASEEITRKGEKEAGGLPAWEGLEYALEKAWYRICRHWKLQAFARLGQKPYFICADSKNDRNIAEGLADMPMTLAIRVTDQECTPGPGAIVHVWQRGARGINSSNAVNPDDSPRVNRGGPREPGSTTSFQLRVLATGADRTVKFDSIYPGTTTVAQSILVTSHLWATRASLSGRRSQSDYWFSAAGPNRDSASLLEGIGCKGLRLWQTVIFRTFSRPPGRILQSAVSVVRIRRSTNGRLRSRCTRRCEASG